MLRYKILKCESNLKDKNQKTYSIVEIGTELGKFTGIAYLHEGDDFSNFLGCSVAESKAYRKFIKKKISFTKERIYELKNLMKMLNCCKQYNKNSFEARRIWRRYCELREELNTYISLYESCSTTTETNLAKRDKVIRDLKLQHQLAARSK